MQAAARAPGDAEFHLVQKGAVARDLRPPYSA
jgi:hypothetical protein